MNVRGTGAYLLSEDGHRIRKCYLKAKIRYDEFVRKRRPIDASWQDYQQWNDWCAYWYGALNDNKDRAVENALVSKRKEKACRRRQRNQRHK